MRNIFRKIIKILLLIFISVNSIFGMYGKNSDWIDFLTDGKQLRVRLDHLGFVLGNDIIKWTFGLNNEGKNFGIIGRVMQYDELSITGEFNSTISIGLGYVSPLISVGFGYNLNLGFVFVDENGKTNITFTHTPVFTINALNDNLRIAIPIQIYSYKNLPAGNTKYSSEIINTEIQLRYYTGIEAFNQLRLYIQYGYQNAGFELRTYFGATIEEVVLNPLLKFKYNQSLFGKGGSERVFENPYNIDIIPALGLNANSDIISLYLEPSLGLKINSDNNKNISYNLGYGVYGEIYITPIKNLELYLEMELGNYDNTSDNYLKFNSSTGITWYLPAL